MNNFIFKKRFHLKRNNQSSMPLNGCLKKNQNRFDIQK